MLSGPAAFLFFSASHCSGTVLTSSVRWSHRNLFQTEAQAEDVSSHVVLNHYRPFALASYLMKTMERLILSQLHSVVSIVMDPLQVACRPNIGVDDAAINLLQQALTHLETTRSTVRVIYFYLSSAFNTIQPSQL